MAYRFFFFAGGNHRGDGANAFTAGFIKYLTQILDKRFSVVMGIYHPRAIKNVIWALNHAQEPEKFPDRDKIISTAVNQIIADPQSGTAEITLASSSYGSVVCAQAGCYLARLQQEKSFLSRPFNIALGASMVSKESGLFKKLQYYQTRGIINTIISDELDDEGDNTRGIGGCTRTRAYLNGLGICFPYLTRKFQGPSFLNRNPHSGHLHWKRAKSIEKANDFLRIILIDYELGGIEAREKAVEKLRE
jgi:hypothetical protein